VTKSAFRNLILASALALVSATCLAAGSDAARETSRVAVKPVVEIELSKTDIMLSDIVASKGLSRTAMEKFRTIKVSDAPLAGDSREFTEAVIAESIKPDLEAVEKETGEHFDIKIPSRVTVTKRKPSLGAADLKQQLIIRFKGICSDCEFEITNLSAPTAAKLPADATWNLRTRSELPKGSFSYPIEVMVGDVQTQTYWVSGQLMIRRPVPVAAREIMIGERMQANDIVTQIKDVTFTNDAPVSLAELSSGVAARQISAGQIVFSSSLRRELAIKMGDFVKVETKTSEWEITLDGVSQTSGYVGDQIKVKIPSTSKIVAGTLREKGIVEVIQ
jgi:flagella basal body P-ring formation protein FlgA